MYILSIDAEKSFNESHFPFVIKSLHKVGVGNFCKVIAGIWKKQPPRTIIIFGGDAKWNSYSEKVWQGFFICLFVCFVSYVSCTGGKGQQIRFCPIAPYAQWMFTKIHSLLLPVLLVRLHFPASFAGRSPACWMWVQMMSDASRPGP